MDLKEIGLGCACVFQADLPELIDAAARHGFGAFTIRPVRFAQALDEGYTGEELRRRADDAGLRVGIVDGTTNGLPGVPRPDELAPEVRAVMPPDVLTPPDDDMIMRAATTMGARLLNLVHYMGPPTPLDVMAEAVGAVCRWAAPYGVSIALEQVPNTGFADIAFTNAVVQTSGEPNCGLNLDFYHLSRSGGTVDDVRRLPPGTILGIQVSDRIAPPPGTAHVLLGSRLMPGEGELPLRELLSAALENNPDATIDLEVISPELRALPVDEAVARLAEATNTWLATL